MPLIETPSYTDFFDDKPVFEELIAGIPTKIILLYCAMINAELFNRATDPMNQARLFGLLTAQFPTDFRKALANKAYKLHGSKTLPFLLFTKKQTFELIHRALLHPCLDHSEAPTADQELRMFKAYLLINDELNDKLEAKAFPQLDYTSMRLTYRTFTWPLMAQQLEINHDLCAKFQSLKLAAFVFFLSTTPPYDKYFPTYLAHVQEDSPSMYLLNVVNFLQHSIRKDTDPSTRERFTFIQPDKPITLLQYLSLDIQAYKDNTDGHNNYKGIKDKPLLEFQQNRYCAFSYGLFVNKIHNGLIFDYYKHSGIKKEPGFGSFANFKSNYGKLFSEETIFRAIINECFSHKYTILEFSDADGTPDCYIRVGSTIFLIEYKDYFFPDSIATECNYELIRQHIDSKFIANENGKPKGVSQLNNVLADLENKCYPFDNFIDKKLKRRNVTIYPVIVHTNRMYTMADINDYLNEHFRSNQPAVSFKVKDLVLIDIETIFSFLQNFRQDKHAFQQLLDDYLAFKKRKQRKFDSSSSIQDFDLAYAAIENLILKLGLKQHEHRMPDYFKQILLSMNVPFNDTRAHS